MGLEKINLMRKYVGMSIDELSEKSGVPKGTLSKITAGITKNPSVDNVKAVVHAMGFTLDDLDDFPQSKGNSLFTDKEIEHIKKYRRLPNSGKEMVDMVLDKEYERAITSKEITYSASIAAYGGNGVERIEITPEQNEKATEEKKKLKFPKKGGV